MACILTELPKCFAVLVLFHVLLEQIPSIKNIIVSSIPPLRLSVEIIEQRHRQGFLEDSVLNILQFDRESVLIIVVGAVFQALHHTLFTKSYRSHFSCL